MWWWPAVRFGRRRVAVLATVMCVVAVAATVTADEIKSRWRSRSCGGGSGGGGDRSNGAARRESCGSSLTAASPPASTTSSSTPQSVPLASPLSFSAPVAVLVGDRTPSVSTLESATAAVTTVDAVERKAAVAEAIQVKHDDTDHASLAADREIRASLGKITAPGGVMAALVPVEMLRTRREAGCDDSACIVLCALPDCSARVVVRVFAYDDAQLKEARRRLSPLRDARHGAVESTLATLLPVECRRHLPELYGTYSVVANAFLLGTLDEHRQAEFRRAHAIAADRLPGFRVYDPRAAIRLSCTVMEHLPFSVPDCVDDLRLSPAERRATIDALVAETARALADLQRVCGFRHNDLHKSNVRLRHRLERTSGGGDIFLRSGSVALIDPDYMCALVSRRPGPKCWFSSSSSASAPAFFFPPAERVCGPCIASVDAEPPGSAFRRRVFDQWRMTPLDAPLRAWYDLATFARSCDLMSLGASRNASASADFFEAHGVEWTGVRPHRVARSFSAADYVWYAADPVAYLVHMRGDTSTVPRAATADPAGLLSGRRRRRR